jgi:hypothetical protein
VFPVPAVRTRAASWQGAAVRPGLVLAVVVLVGIAALAAVVAAVRDRPPGRLVLALAALAEAAVLVQSTVGLVVLVRGERPPETVTAVAYLLGVAVVLPLAAAWALVERTRWSGVVIAVAGLTVLVMTARLQMLWRGVGG